MHIFDQQSNAAVRPLVLLRRYYRGRYCTLGINIPVTSSALYHTSLQLIVYRRRIFWETIMNLSLIG